MRHRNRRLFADGARTSQRCGRYAEYLAFHRVIVGDDAAQKTFDEPDVVVSAAPMDPPVSDLDNQRSFRLLQNDMDRAGQRLILLQRPRRRDPQGV